MLRLVGADEVHMPLAIKSVPVTKADDFVALFQSYFSASRCSSSQAWLDFGTNNGTRGAWSFVGQ